MKNSRVFKIFSTKLIWKRPKQVDVIIIDRMGSNYVIQILPKCSYLVVDTRNESLNISVLLSKIWFFDKNTYLDTYLKITSPKLVITNIDNNINY